MEIRPLSDTLGAEVIGIDLAQPLDDDSFAKVHRAHLDHLVVVFRDQHLSPDDQIAFSKRFGPLISHPADDATLAGFPDILVVSTKKENGQYIGLPDGGPMWHSDLAYVEKPSLGSMLYALEIPERGGNTGFANMYTAYETLPGELKRAIEGRQAVNLAGRSNAKRDFRRALNQAQRDKFPAVIHPLVRTHPETGRKCIFANPQHTLEIVGIAADESDAILERLFAHITQDEFTYFHRWRPHDLVFWDNRCALHIADLTRLDDPSYIRHMHRTTIEGDRPF
jgi:taurine dioxygenase